MTCPLLTEQNKTTYAGRAVWSGPLRLQPRTNDPFLWQVFFLKKLTPHCLIGFVTFSLGVSLATWMVEVNTCSS